MLAPARPPTALKNVGKILLFCFLFTTAVLAFSCIALSRDKATMRQEIQANFANGALLAAPYIGADVRRGWYLVNDCFILSTLVNGTGPVLADVVNSTVLSGVTAGPCQNLQDAAAGTVPAAPYSYSRYFWGAKAFAGPALAWASLDTTKSWLRLAVYGTLLLAAGLAAAGLARGGAKSRGLHVTVLIAAACLLTLYDLKYFAVTLAHGFSELVLAFFLLHAAVAPPEPASDAIPLRYVVLGCFTAWFELLTGPMVMAIGLAMLVENAAASGPGAVRRSVRAGAVTAFSIVACLLFLQLFVLIAGDASTVVQFFYHVALRMQLHHWLQIPVEAEWQSAENLRSYTTVDVYRSVVNALPRLTGGSAGLAHFIFGASVAGLGLALAAAWRKQAGVRDVLAYVLVALFLALWYVIFANHTVIHAWGMVRVSVLLPMCAAIAMIRALAPAPWWSSRSQGV